MWNWIWRKIRGRCVSCGGRVWWWMSSYASDKGRCVQCGREFVA